MLVRVFFAITISFSATAVAVAAPSYVDPWAASTAKVARPTVALRISWPEKVGDSQKTKIGYGTAFLISSSGHYLTAGHLIPDGVDPSKILIEAESRPFQQNKAGPIRLKLVGQVQRSQLVDAAVLQAEGNGIPAEPLYWNPAPVRQTQQLLVIGYNGESTSIAKLPTVEGSGDDGTIMLSAFVQEGFSGSPVVDVDGLVVGMIRGGKPVAEYKDTGTTGFALFVPVSSISTTLPKMAGINWPQANVTPQFDKANQNPAASEDVVKQREAVATGGILGGANSKLNIPDAVLQSSRIERPVARAPAPAGDSAPPVRTITIPKSEGIYPPISASPPSLSAPSIASPPAPPSARARVAVSNPIPIKLSRSVNVARPISDKGPVEPPAVIVEALEGYRVKTADFEVYSEAGATKTVTIDPKGEFAALKFSLAGDPAKSNSRGWLRGDFVVTMEPK